MGIALGNDGKRDEAIAKYRKAIELDPTSAGAYVNLSELLKDKGDLEGALRAYNEGIHLKPDLADAYYDRADAWKQKDQPAAAISDLQQYLSLGGGVREGDSEKVEAMIRDLKTKL